VLTARVSDVAPPFAGADSAERVFAGSRTATARASHYVARGGSNHPSQATTEVSASP